MSSLTHESGSRTGYRLRVYTAAGRRSIWLGRIPGPDAVAIQRHVDEILAAQTADIPYPRATVRWLEALPHAMRIKLQAVTGAMRTVATAADEYIDARSAQWSIATMESVTRSLGHLTDALGTRRIDAVSIEDIADAAEQLGQGPSTRGKIAKDWRAMFAWCIDRHWITDNPARHLATTITVRDKQFISADLVVRVMAACTDPELHLVIALSRFAGLRISSEIRHMEWSHFDRERARLRVIDTKRGCERLVPISIVVLQSLDRQPAGELLGQIRTLSHAAITARFTRLLHQCNIAPWSPLWHSMRASRETEWIRQFGVATATQWIGNSPTVALRNYGTVPDTDWGAAVG